MMGSVLGRPGEDPLTFPEISGIRGPNGGTLHRITAAQRFWMKVDRSGECWIWLAGCRNGYGAFNMAAYRQQRRQIPAHRAAWELTQGQGELPDEIEACHICDNRLCVRLSHLFLGTHADNMLDCHAKGRHPGNGGKVPRGAEHPNTHLTEADVREIRALQGVVTVKTAAARFGICGAEIWRIQHRQRWAHVPDLELAVA